MAGELVPYEPPPPPRMIEREKPGWRRCHFCTEWRIYVTAVDAITDVRVTYAQHLKRHAEVASMADLEAVIFADLVKTIDN